MFNAVVFRISQNFSSIQAPGAGLNIFQHCKYSKFTSIAVIEHKVRTYRHLKGLTLFRLRRPPFRLFKNTHPLLFNFFFLLGLLIFAIQVVPLGLKYRPKYVHVYTPVHLFTGVLLKLICNSKLFVSFHGSDIHSLHNDFLIFFLRRFVDKVLIIAESMRPSLEFLGLPIYYMGNGCDFSDFNTLKTVSPLNFDFILAVGGLRPVKNYDLLFRSYAHSLQLGLTWNLVIVGDGPDKKSLTKLAQDLSISKNLFMINSCDQSTLSRYYKSAKCLALSSFSEGSPKVIIEALSCGTPVVSTDVGDARKLIQRAGIVVKSMTTGEFSSALYKLWKFHPYYSSLIDKSSITSWEDVASRLDSIYLS